MTYPDLPFIRSAQDCSSHGASVEAETDCACPADDALPDEGLPASVDAEQPYLLAGDLYTDRLDENLTLVFHSRGRHGVVILDEIARRLLADFARPRPIAILRPDLRQAAAKLAALELIAPAGQAPRSVGDSSQTLTAWLHVTNACNLRCSYCFLSKTAEALELERGRQAVESIFRSARSHGFRAVKLKYAGGEASMNLPLVLALHAHARDLGAAAGLAVRGVLLTNGVALGARAIKSLREADLRVAISLDGIGAAHDAVRPTVNGRGSFARVQRTLNLLAAGGVTPSLTVTLTAHNLAGLPEVVAYALECDLPFALNFYREHDCATGVDLGFSDDEAMTALRAAFARIAARPPRHSVLGLLVDRARLDAPHGRACGAGHSYLVVDQQGRFATCHMQIERTMADVGAPDPLAIVRETSIGVRAPHVDTKPDCRTCSWRYQCAGGCPVLASRGGGSVLARSPYCGLYRALFPEVLRLEAHRILAHAC